MTRAKPERQTESRITRIRPVDDGHQVVTVEGGRSTLRHTPCGGCPWRVDQTGVFPAKAFEHSAGTAYDMSTHVFSCHESGAKKPAICAGFLLRGADHNLAVRLKTMRREIDWDSIADGGHELHEGYRAMAVANGVPEDAEVLAPCR